MKSIAAFVAATWSSALILYFGQHSLSMMALSGVIALGALDTLAP